MKFFSVFSNLKKMRLIAHYFCKKISIKKNVIIFNSKAFFIRLVSKPARSRSRTNGLGLGLVRRTTSTASSLSNLIPLSSIQKNGLGRERATPRTSTHGLGVYSPSASSASSASSLSNRIPLRSIHQNGLGRERADGLVRATPRPSRRSAHGLGIYSSSQSTGVNSKVHCSNFRD